MSGPSKKLCPLKEYLNDPLGKGYPWSADFNLRARMNTHTSRLPIVKTDALYPLKQATTEQRETGLYQMKLPGYFRLFDRCLRVLTPEVHSTKY